MVLLGSHPTPAQAFHSVSPIRLPGSATRCSDRHPSRSFTFSSSSPSSASSQSKTSSLHMAESSSSSSSSASPSKQKKEQHTPVTIRLIGNFMYALTAPFPGLRRVLLQQQDRQSQTDGGTIEQSMALPLRTALLAVGTYLAIGVLAFHFIQEEWTIVDALYFSCVCFSTVGYGDLCPTTAVGKLFTCVFGFTGIALLGAVVASLGSKLVSLEMEAVGRVKLESKKRLLKIYDLMPKIVRKSKKTTSVKEKKKIFQQINDQLNQTTYYSNDTQVMGEEEESLPALLAKPVPMRIRIWKAILWMSKSLLVVIVGGIFIGRLEGWSLCDSIYYSIVTATTIGLGDFAPKTRHGRIAAIFMIPTLVAAAGEVLAGIGLALIAHRQKQVYQAQLRTGLTEEYLERMDKNGDGQVSREEYILYMLMEMGAVNQYEIDELCKQFRKLDVARTGYIDKMDLLLMQELRNQQESQPSTL
ncbi:Kef-type transporter NAD-binding protein 2 [Nitzschia inconspicua]|uniref:Kef-type transporter NAD-binding protein 2 n=1 Tax=Nitzschia inconspicua TaxID=303405 RepID=A0A9K3KHH6_9STRA|nr:Kef-type transporter NAD-binding protein 2 [Nitzschia inconspicua]